MSTPREIRNKISSIRKIQKITNAMQNVAASKMRQAQKYMETSMPYASKISEVVGHIANSENEFNHPYLRKHKEFNNVGYFVISTDRGLCGGLNINLFKSVLEHSQKFQQKGINSNWCLMGKKADGFFQAISSNIVARTSNLGEKPKVADIIGCIKVMLDDYKEEKIDRLFIASNEFVNTIVQKPKIVQILPLERTDLKLKYNTSYIFEPKSVSLVDTLMMRYIESQVYQAVVDNIACEQVARMIAMQNATENTKDIIEDLQLVYNKARQATITQEISEIVGGANAV